MNELLERWPALAALSPIPLCDLPTPVQRLPSISDKVDASVWVKRDDLTARPYGGNKVRKLEFLLAHARERGADTLVTWGGVGSHHVFATALYGREHGFTVHAVLTPQPYHPHVEDQLRAILAVEAQIYSAPNVAHALREVVVLATRLRLQGRRPYVIPLGGSNVWGALGYVNAGLELAKQIDAGQCPDPHAVYVACGSCATSAGLALGLRAGGVSTTVVAVRATDRLFANPLRLKRLVYQTEHLLRRLDPHFPRVAGHAFESLLLDHVEFGRGYGKPTPSSEAAAHLAATEGIVLGHTYTGKALASLLRDAESDRRGQNLLFWNTLSSAPLSPFLVHAPEAPAEFVRLMTLDP